MYFVFTWIYRFVVQFPKNRNFEASYLENRWSDHHRIAHERGPTWSRFRNGSWFPYNRSISTGCMFAYRVWSSVSRWPFKWPRPTFLHIMTPYLKYPERVCVTSKTNRFRVLFSENRNFEPVYRENESTHGDGIAPGGYRGSNCIRKPTRGAESVWKIFNLSQKYYIQRHANNEHFGKKKLLKTNRQGVRKGIGTVSSFPKWYDINLCSSIVNF